LKLFLAGVAICVLLLGGGGLGAWSWAKSEIDSPRRVGQGAITVNIPPGTSVSGIGGILQRAGLIGNPVLFEAYLRLHGEAGKLEAGTYQVPAGLDLPQLILILERNTHGASLSFTIPEGWTAGQIGRAAESKGLFPAAGYADVVAHGSFPDGFLADRPAGADLQGYLFPDTYFLAPGVTPTELVQLQLQRFGEVVTPEIRARAQSHGLSFYQALVMASIVEREASFPEDRPQIARVFYNRLAAGMPLDDDATLLFAKGVTSGFVSDQDKQIDSPYNTYRHAGLPPGPICNPGLAAIESVLDPADNDYLYFITDSSGHAHFARTLAEHNALVQQYGAR
jgi:UPF0755 protein